MPIQYVTINSGFTVSSAVALLHAPRALAVEIPTSVTGQTRVQFAGTLDAASISFSRLTCPTGTGLDFIVTSGPGWGVVPQVPFGFVRIEIGAAKGFAVTSIGIYPVQ